jgi:hypothetical protein
MQAKVIYTKRSNITEEHTSDPEQTGLERRLEMRIRLEDMPSIPSNRYYRGPAPGWIPDSVYLTESLLTGYGEDEISHWRQVEVSGHLLKKDGTVGKLTTDNRWRTYSSAQISGSMESMPAALHEALAQVIPAFKKGTLPA